MTPKTLAWLTLLATVAFGVSPYLTDPFSGYTADVLPNFDPDPAIQPAGYAFAIWGVIYLWLGVSAVYGVVARSNDMNWAASIVWLLPSLAIGAFWTWIANQSAIWGTITIWLMLATALRAATQAPWDAKWWLKAPVALYAGWLSAAACVSLGVTLPGFGIGFAAATWAVILIAVAALLAATMQIRIGAIPTYGIAVLWAFVGIIAGNSDDIVGVYWAASLGIGLVAASMVLALRTKD